VFEKLPLEILGEEFPASGAFKAKSLLGTTRLSPNYENGWCWSGPRVFPDHFTTAYGTGVRYEFCLSSKRKRANQP
jgi:hypothetical protein